jgi:hypothetical protein
MKTVKIVFIVIVMSLISANYILAERINPVIKEIDELIINMEKSKKRPADRQYDSIRGKIEKEPETVLPLLISNANRKDLSNAGLSIYIWALGVTKSPDAVDSIIKLASEKKSESIDYHAYMALGEIGGKKSGDYLYNRLKNSKAPEERYCLFKTLAEIKYLEAIRETTEVLRYKESWRSVFVFGKYGDSAIPFLMEQINDTDREIRGNAIMMLGHWLIATQSLAALKKRFWVEKDPQIRTLILSSLERINVSLEDTRAFSQEVVSREKNADVLKYAEEIIGGHDLWKERVRAHKAGKIENRSIFDSEYKSLYVSLGNLGSYERLSSASTKDDEEKLKILKEVVLQRDSDECLYSYNKINLIIVLNRLM